MLERAEQGLAAGKRRMPIAERMGERESTIVPGVQRAPYPSDSHACGTW
jgi:hypothetical protein